ncbi:hypothetical protein ACHAXA_002397 [Cyclostephanos tholiformis]|uniref:AB hydrolase-1 domain-containing protein n=1 Tax=Cyclostephanos tholiformis TaxID=382380 RepID=A0ABD3R2H5_9STRA
MVSERQPFRRTTPEITEERSRRRMETNDVRSINRAMTMSSSNAPAALLLLLLLTTTLSRSPAWSFPPLSSAMQTTTITSDLASVNGGRRPMRLPRRPHPPSSTMMYGNNGHDGSATTSTTSAAAATEECREVDDGGGNCGGVVDLRYSEFLPPTATGMANHPPVIFLHGLLGNKRNFASLASSLSSQLRNPRTIYALDLRNHGENSHDWRSSMSYSEMARDVLAFMDCVVANNNNDDGRAVLVGHSMGGKVAQCLALMHPDRVAGLVVLDIAPVRYRSSGSGQGGGGNKGDGTGWRAVEEIVRSVSSLDLGELGTQATKRDVDRALRSRSSTLEDPALRAFVLTNLEQVAVNDRGGVDGNVKAPALRWKVNWDGIVNELDRIAGFDVHDRAMDDGVVVDPTPSSSSSGEVIEPRRTEGDDEHDGNGNDTNNNVQYKGDVFFIHGGASRFVRHSHISTIASYFPNHMLTTIRGSGHWVHAEAPDDTIALLKRYLDR